MTIQETAALLRQQDHILILTHRRPDGDTLGCAAALCECLRSLDKTAYVLQNPDTTDLYRPYVEAYWAPEGFVPEFVVSVDIAAKGLFFPAAERYLDRVDLAIDHHPSYEGFGKVSCVDPSRAACGEIVYEICLELGAMTQAVALPLYVAIATDTGCFVYANTTANTHAVAAALMGTGIDAGAVNKRHFRTKSRKRLLLEADMLSNMEFFQDGRVVFLSVPLSLMERLGADENDAEDLATLATLVGGVDCGAVLRELPGGEWKISLRTDGVRVNATEVCKRLGGGGHAAAAGATVPGSLDEAKVALLSAINAVGADCP